MWLQFKVDNLKNYDEHWPGMHVQSQPGFKNESILYFILYSYG